MSRGLTSAMTTALSGRKVRPAMLVELEFDSGTDHLWTGYGDLPWDSKTWTGGGDVMSVRPFSESTDIRANGASVVLSGIPSARISIALSEDYQGRTATLYLAVIDDSGAVIADPIQFSGRMDQMNIEEDGQTATIALSIESQLVDLNKSREFRYTDQDQRIDYPNDKGFEYVAGLQDKAVTWGPDNRNLLQKIEDGDIVLPPTGAPPKQPPRGPRGSRPSSPGRGGGGGFSGPGGGR